MNRRILLATTLASCLAACSSAATLAPASPTTAPPTTAVTTTAPTGTPAPTSAGCPAPGVFPTGEFPACSYSAPVAGLTATFNITGPGWGGDLFADGFDVGYQGAGFTVTHFDGSVFSDPCSSTSTTTKVDRSPAGLIAAIQANPKLKAGLPSGTTLAGAAATEIDVTADVVPACATRVYLFVLPIVGEFHLDTGESARLIAAEIGGQTIVAVEETFPGTDQATFLAKVQPIVDSLAIH